MGRLLDSDHLYTGVQNMDQFDAEGHKRNFQSGNFKKFSRTVSVPGVDCLIPLYPFRIHGSR